MDKARIKKFSQFARSKLIPQMGEMIDFWMGAEEVSGGLRVGTKFFNDTKIDTYTDARRSLMHEIKKYGKESVAEQAAYIRFNRVIALRYMEIHRYLPIKSSLFTSDDGGQNPDIIKNALYEYAQCGLDEKLVFDLESKHEYAELYRFMFIGLCNQLSHDYGFIFSKIDNRSILLFPKDILSTSHIINHATSGLLQIPDEDWQEVEIIGWMYQYYISEKKDELFEAAKTKNKKFGKDELTAVTQLFTPKRIVQYMVQNTVGKTWLQNNPDINLQSKREFYIQAEADKYISIDDPKELTILDPACGSGHILVTSFELLFDIYLNAGYARGSIPQLIIDNNLYGFEVCERAHQLACFAVLMKAKGYDPDIQSKVRIGNHIICIEENNNFEEIDEETYPLLRDFVKNRHNASIYGSLITVLPFDSIKIQREYDAFVKKQGMFAEGILNQKQLNQLFHQSELLSDYYVCTIANPPYMGGGNMDDKIKKFITQYYPDYKADLFAPFVHKILGYTRADGKVGLVTPFVWMFIKSYEYLRNYIITNNHIASLVKPSYTAFFESAIVPLCSYCVEKHASNSKGSYFDLGYLGGADEQAPKLLQAIHHPNEVNYSYTINQSEFEKIPGSPIAYNFTSKLFDIYKKNKTISSIAETKQGAATGNNDYFLKDRWEVLYKKIYFDGKNLDEVRAKKNVGYVPFNKGGDYRRRYGNHIWLLVFNEKGYDELLISGNKLPSKNLYFHESLSRSKISSSNFSMRYYPSGFVFSDAGQCLFLKKENEGLKYYLLGFLHTPVVSRILSSLSGTMNFTTSDIDNLPIIISTNKEYIDKTVQENINISKQDRDLHENSRKFNLFHLIVHKQITLEQSYQKFCNVWTEIFFQIHTNEEELNRQFIEIYGLQNELIPNMPLSEITILQDELDRNALKRKGSEIIKTKQLPRKREVIAKQLMSYILGCIMGRYSLDTPGLTYAGGERDISKYKTFLPDEDAIIPVLDDTYFEDDIVERTKEFIKTVRGKDNFTQNLQRLAESLEPKSNKSNEDIIREYRQKKFMDDHYSNYSKRPIYWYFASNPKKGKAAFQAIVYLHRINNKTISRLRHEYLHKFQAKLEAEQERLQDHNDRDSEKRKTQLRAILSELAEYDKKLKNFADKEITIDLDDGVKKNYGMLMKEGIVVEYKM